MRRRRPDSQPARTPAPVFCDARSPPAIPSLCRETVNQYAEFAKSLPLCWTPLARAVERPAGKPVAKLTERHRIPGLDDVMDVREADFMVTGRVRQITAR